MNNKIASLSKSSGVRLFRFGLPLLTLLLCSNARAANYQDIDLNNCPPPYPVRNCGANNELCYAAAQGIQANSISDGDISVSGFSTPTNVSWSLTREFGCAGGTSPTYKCDGTLNRHGHWLRRDRPKSDRSNESTYRQQHRPHTVIFICQIFPNRDGQ